MRWRASAVRMAALIVCLLLCFYYNDLYSGRPPRDRRDLALRLGKSYVAAGIFLSLLYYAIPWLTLGRGILLLHLPVSILLMLIWRISYHWAIQSESLVENVLILGTGPTAQEIAREVLTRNKEGYRVLGFLGTDPEEIGRSIVNPSVLGTIDELAVMAQQAQVDTVVVALEDRRGKLPLSELVRCKTDGVRVEEAASFYETLSGQIPIRHLNPSWLIFSEGFRKSRLFRNTRRFFELGAALLAVLIALPVLLIACLFIWMETGRPIFFRQERVGEKGKNFTLFKLRTMHKDAEKGTGAVWAQANGDDPRITKVGGFLRKNRIDELPQLFNVLRGEMSFVGPRPERPQFVDQLREVIPFYDERHAVKPGITGWAQVRYGYGSTVEEAETKLQYDLYYIKNMSVWLDIMIVMDTAKVVILGRGAR